MSSMSCFLDHDVVMTSVTVALYVWTCSENVSESNQVALQVSFSQSDNVTAQPTMCVELDANMTYANNGLVYL